MTHAKNHGIAALAAKGRNGDNTLVHMTHEEVAALQRFAKHHGKSLTINPETGLPEAFSLTGLLPMMGGAAGMMFGIPPWVTAAAIGGLQTAATGDISKGITAGLGAYGGGNLAAGFGAGTMGAAEAGAAGAETGATQAGTIGANTAGMGGGTGLTTQPVLDASIGAEQGLGGYGGAGAAEMGGGAGMTAQPTMSAGLDAGLTAPADSQGIAALPNSAETMGTAAPTSRLDLAASNWDKTTSGIQNLGTEQGRDAYMAKMGGGSGLAKTGLQALAPALMWGGGQTGNGAPEPNRGSIRNYTLDRGQSAGGERTGGRGERRYFADRWTEGPVTALADGGGVPGYAFGGVAGMVSKWLKEQDAGQNKYASYDPETQEYVTNYANGGGIMALAQGGTLGNYSDGGQALRGPGDGVSDSIPATINGAQPAKLADGEFVVPARIVSELGNGSSEAGTRQLYAMLDRIQKQRGKTVGKGKVAVDSKATKHLPA